MTEFKVGDEVIVTNTFNNDAGNDNFPVGETKCIITRASINGVCRVNVDGADQAVFTRAVSKVEVGDRIKVGKRYSVPGTRYERTIIFRDERSVVFEEKNGVRNLCNLATTKEWVEIIPEEWHNVWRNSAGDIKVSQKPFPSAHEAAVDKTTGKSVEGWLGVIRVDGDYIQTSV